MTLTTVVETSITAFDSAEWDRCFPADPENWAFYHACEQAGPPGFTWYYATVRDNGRPIAVVPAFGTEYRIDTTMQGIGKRITNRLYQLLPALISLRLIALGSPIAEICHLGFAPEVAAHDRPALLKRIIAALHEFGAAKRYGLLGIKDAPSRDDGLWRSALLPSGFTRLPGLPTAVLDLPYADFEAYLASLSKATRKDMRRKLKAFSEIRVEQRREIDDVVGQVSALYEQTVAHSELQFERLPPDFFPQLLRSLAPEASIFLYWHGEELVAFNFVIETADRLIDKYIGMNYAVVPQFSLYFNSWLHNVRYCIERDIPLYQSGQAFYGPKLRLGCRLQPNWQYFRHRNAALNTILQFVAKFVRLDRFDPAIANLVKDAA
ncbi:GNAT family N-acetyltransferase [Labrys neptuniae]